MSQYGGPVPWWRVVHADGSLAVCHDGGARQHLVAEGTRFRPSGSVDMAAALWSPDTKTSAGIVTPPAVGRSCADGPARPLTR